MSPTSTTPTLSCCPMSAHGSSMRFARRLCYDARPRGKDGGPPAPTRLISIVASFLEANGGPQPPSIGGMISMPIDGPGISAGRLLASWEDDDWHEDGC